MVVKAYLCQVSGSKLDHDRVGVTIDDFSIMLVSIGDGVSTTHSLLGDLCAAVSTESPKDVSPTSQTTAQPPPTRSHTSNRADSPLFHGLPRLLNHLPTKRRH
jgi:hypothetical protein